MAERWSGSVLPFSRGEDGRVVFDSDVGLIGSIKRALLPKAVYPGKVDPMSEEGIAAANELAGLAALGGFRSPKQANSLGADTPLMYDPPKVPVRPFEWDYPVTEGRVGADGKLARTIDGDEIAARYVVGRAEEGGGDVALPREAYDALAKAGTGKGVVVGAVGGRGQEAGFYRKTRLSSDEIAALKPWERDATDGFERSVGVRAGLADDEFARVAQHELGHMGDDIAGVGVMPRHGKPKFREIMGLD